MTDITSRKQAMIWGALVADAATMGTHWIYDQPRIRDIAPTTPEFRTPTAADYEGIPAYFAHPTRRTGDLSQYGEQMLVMLDTIITTGGYDQQSYQTKFRETFGYGGSYVGYIDRPTRDTLDNITTLEKEASEEAEATQSADALPGADDEQLPAVSKLPPMIAAGITDPATIENAARVTNNNDSAVAYAQYAASILKSTLTSGDTPDFTALLQTADAAVAQTVTPVLTRSDTTEAVTADIGLSCYLKFGLPSITHNLLTAPSYTDGIRSNIYAGGDNCGRSIILGAALGAIHGIGGDTGIPTEWINRLTAKQTITDMIDRLP